MLAQKAQAPFDSQDHVFEIKWDGIRCLALVEAGRVRLQSRRGLDLTFQFPELACLEQLPSGTVLDGELVVLEEGRPSLRQVQQRALLENRQRIEFVSRISPATYMVFDLLYLKGKWLMASPFSLRREALQAFIARFPLPGVLVPEGVRTHGCQLFAQAMRLGLEGVMAKRLDSPYLPGKRSPRNSGACLMTAGRTQTVVPVHRATPLAWDPFHQSQEVLPGLIQEVSAMALGGFKYPRRISGRKLRTRLTREGVEKIARAFLGLAHMDSDFTDKAEGNGRPRVSAIVQKQAEAGSPAASSLPLLAGVG